jgi:hypothetical protein
MNIAFRLDVTEPGPTGNIDRRDKWVIVKNRCV